MNYCEHLLEHQQRTPDLPALRYFLPDGEWATLSYTQLLARAAVYQSWMNNAGLKAGDRLLVLMRPGADFYALLYAMLGAGIVPVLVEKGMSVKNLRGCLQQARLSAVLVEKDIATRWFLLPELWSVRRFTFDAKRYFMAHLPDFAYPASGNDGREFHTLLVDDDTTALITFTNGSTGLPKGVPRSHRSLLAQSRALAHFFPQQQHRDISSFPVLTLFCHFLGGCSYLLPPAEKDGTLPVQLIAQTINSEAITRLSVSPAWIHQLLEYADEQDAVFSSVKQVIIGGAPVTPRLLLGCLRYFPLAKCGVNYGATEAEPISYIDMATLLKEWHQRPGYLAGAVGEGTQILIRRQPCSHPQEIVPLPAETEGEILVSGPQVLESYLNNPEADYLNKITDSAGRIWHCTGDSGFLDAQHRLWLTGRLKDQLHTRSGLSVSPFTVEKKLNALPGINVSAVVQGAQDEIGVVLSSAARCRIAAPLLADMFPGEAVSFYVLASFPVDARHHSRIDRARLRQQIKQRKLKPINPGEHS